jgi:hypothetical protein
MIGAMSPHVLLVFLGVKITLSCSIVVVKNALTLWYQDEKNVLYAYFFI